jgi:hypothetical protein
LSHKKTPLLTAAILAAALSVSAVSSAFAQASSGLEAFVGRWQMNAGKTKMGRMGPNGANIVRDPTFTWQFTPTDVFTRYPQPSPTRTMTVIVDEKQHPCQGPGPCLTTGGNPAEQFYSYFKMDSKMLARLFYDKGQVVEYSTYSVSTDGKTLSIVSWSPETPEFHNIQVFDKQP